MIKTARHQAIELWEDLNALGVEDTTILDHLIANWLSGSEALRGLQDLAKELDLEDSEDSSEC